MSYLWKDDEEAVLREQYGTLTLKVIGEMIGRSADACEKRARLLGLTPRDAAPEEAARMRADRYVRQAVHVRKRVEHNASAPWPRVTTNPEKAMAGRRFEDAPAELRRRLGDGHPVMISQRWYSRFHGSGCGTAAELCVG